MSTVSCLLIDDDPEEHEIFMISIEQNFDCSASWSASSIQQAIADVENGIRPIPACIFIDWSVIRDNPAAGHSALKSAFPNLAGKFIVLSGVLPQVDHAHKQLFNFREKQCSIEQNAAMLKTMINLSRPQRWVV
ncbi:MAG TPA: hypothetical protein VGN64_05200 [Dyadobacter sp.]|jgi:hypothetical protein|nr:hypothetical protein [Dyadobacter sp.]